MNKKFFLSVALAAVVGGLSAFLVGGGFKDDGGSSSSKVIEVSDNNQYKFTTSTRSENGVLPDLVYAAENTVKAVVGVENIQRVASQNQYYGGGYDPFLEFFGIPGGGSRSGGSQSQPRESKSGGSGVIISKDGYIVTNNHVIDNASELNVTLEDGRKFPAKLVGTDPTTDVALLKIDAQDLPVVVFGDSEKLRLGEWLIAVGNPYGLSSTVTAGIVSAKGRNLDVIPSQFRLESFIQTDAAVNPGNSGGALVNTAGELIGINTVIKSPTGSFTGYSFAVPSTIVKKVIVDLMEYGVVQRAMMGIGYNEINEQFIEQQGAELGIKESGGLYIGTVDPDGAAAEAGVKVGDILLEIEGVKTNNSAQLQEQIAKYRPNDKVEIVIKRGKDVKHIELLLRNKSGEAKLLDKNSVDVVAFLGGEFRDLDSATLRKLDVKNGVQVVKVGSGLLSRAGVKEGFIITHINGVAIRSVSDLERLTQNVQNIDGLYSNGRYMSYMIVTE